ncbi:unnamed protein product, partial [Citrullus colocynthis]
KGKHQHLTPKTMILATPQSTTNKEQTHGTHRIHDGETHDTTAVGARLADGWIITLGDATQLQPRDDGALNGGNDPGATSAVEGERR